MSTLAYISTPPPTPHQLAIAHLASRLFPLREVAPVEADTWFNKNAKYHNAMLRLISREALFGAQPSSFRALMKQVTDITLLGKPVKGRCELLHLAPQTTLKKMHLSRWSLFADIPDVYYEREDEGPHTSNRIASSYHTFLPKSIETHTADSLMQAYISPLGTFLRKVYLGYKTLSFQQTDILREQMLEWCSMATSDQKDVKIGVQSRSEADGVSQQPFQQIQPDLAHPMPETAEAEKSAEEERMQEVPSGMTTVSMDISVTMDISERQEESMDMSLEHSESVVKATAQEIEATDTPANQQQSLTGNPEASTRPTVSAETFVRPDHNPMKRRRLVNKFTELDDTLDVRVQMFKEYGKDCYQSACVRGDYSLALHSLDRFYNYRFPGHDKKLHQHALLNLASFHYNTGGLESARHILHEAIKVARIEGDQQCLLHCVSLGRRIEAEITVPVSSVLVEGLPPHASDVGPEGEVIPPIDELWNIKRRLDLGEALPDAYNRVWTAAARDASIRKNKRNFKANRNQDQQSQGSAQKRSDLNIPETLLAGVDVLHSVQASLWHMFGSTVLGDLHEQLALRASSSSSQQLLLNITAGRAQRLVTQSRYTDALAVMLDGQVNWNLSIGEYHRWVHEIWSIVDLIVKRCGVTELLDTCKHFRLPTAAYRQLGAGGPLRMIPDPSQDLMFDAFGRDQDLPERRTTDKLGVHLGAAEVASIDREVQVNFAHPLQTGSSRPGDSSLISIAMREVEGIWDKILASGDDELISNGAHVLASSKLKQDPEAAMEFAKLALKHAMNLGHQQKIGSSAKVLSIAFHNIGRRMQRDVVAAFWLEVQKARSVEDWYQSGPHNTLLREVYNDPFAMGRVKHELRALGKSVGLLPEIIARVGVALASNQATICR
ncbi:hypothetical protein QFC22_000186 [Naganishia vaughanmartiniae]|uniref:Uncharacterized protein n=1 Tax=Naganishia vaughanmartiniae TaxID=1424756 RepID=A0ACC2XQE2_9TREE|nr:hypothetical protein QFC22_000186 [Naganishia vaughanmartiniae]